MNKVCTRNLSDTSLQERYARWGGIPRFVFHALDEDVDVLIGSGVTQASVDSFTKILKYGSYVSEIEFCHRLIQLKIEGENQSQNSPNISPTDIQFYDLAYVDFASEVVRSQLMKFIRDDSIVNALKFPSLGVSDPKVASLYGKVLESFFVDELERHPGKTFTVRKLNENGNLAPEELLLIPSIAVIKRFNDINDLTKLFKENPSNIFIPQRKIFGAIDGILPGGRLFNVVINDKHSLSMVNKMESKNAGLVQIAKSIGHLPARPSHKNKEKPIVHFYLVVPDTLYKNFTKPLPLHGHWDDDGQGTAVPNYYEADMDKGIIVHQWVLKLDVSYT